MSINEIRTIVAPTALGVWKQERSDLPNLFVFNNGVVRATFIQSEGYDLEGYDVGGYGVVGSKDNVPCELMSARFLAVSLMIHDSMRHNGYDVCYTRRLHEAVVGVKDGVKITLSLTEMYY